MKRKLISISASFSSSTLTATQESMEITEA